MLPEEPKDIESAETTLPTPPPLPAAELAEPLLQVRIGGQPGVRVRESGGITQTVRVSGITQADHRAVPREVLRAVSELLTGEDGGLEPGARLQALRELLGPWLEAE